MTEQLRQELSRLARAQGLTDEMVGRCRVLVEAAYNAGLRDARAAAEKPRPAPPAKGVKP